MGQLCKATSERYQIDTTREAPRNIQSGRAGRRFFADGQDEGVISPWMAGRRRNSISAWLKRAGSWIVSNPEVGAS
jgi:hypothetical protein